MKLSFRLVAGQDPEHVRAAGPRLGARTGCPPASGTRSPSGPATRPCLTPLDHPALQSVVRAMGRAFGTPSASPARAAPARPPTSRTSSARRCSSSASPSRPTAGTRPNEKVELDLLLKGVETSAYLWGDLAEHWRHAP